MKPEALEAIAGPTIRPNALQAAAAIRPSSEEGLRKPDGIEFNEKSPPEEQPDAAQAAQSEHVKKPSYTPKSPSTPFGQHTDGTESAAKAVEVVVHGVKVAVDGTIAWAEKKVEELGSTTDNIGPYTSPATCAPSDLDPIASGVLPAMPLQQENGAKEREGEKNEHEDGEEEIVCDKQKERE
jgi:hypothetical protein